MRWLVVAVVSACASPPAPPPATPQPAAPRALAADLVELGPLPPPPEPAPLVISAPRAVRWTHLAEAWFSTSHGGHSTFEAFRNPILAQSVRGDRYAAVVFTDHVMVATARLPGTGTLTEVPLPIQEGRAAAIVLDDQTARMAVLREADVVVATVSLDSASVLAAHTLEGDATASEMHHVFRVGGGWLVIGIRDGDLVSRTVADGAKRLPARSVIAAHGADPPFVAVRGAVANDGSVLVSTTRTDDGAAERWVARYHRGRWQTIAARWTDPQLIIAADRASRWLLACAWGCEVAPTARVLPNAGDLRAVISAPADAPPRSATRAYTAGDGVYLLSEYRTGVRYDLAHQTRTLFAPPASDAARGWLPREALVLRDQLCLLGGQALGPAPDTVVREMHGAACLDPAGNWTWLASDPTPVPERRAVGSGCEPIGEAGGETLAACWTRHKVPRGHYDVGWGAFAWTLWRVARSP